MRYIDPDGLISMETSQSGIDFIVSYEGGFYASIYDARNPSNAYERGKEGDWTIGFGHKLTDLELESGIYDNGITEDSAKELFAEDLSWFEQGINRNFEGETLSQEQFDSLVSLGYNIGRSGLVNSDLFTDVENGVTDESTILSDFRKYINSNGMYMEGLEKRRYDEAELFLFGDYTRNNDLTLDNPN